MQRYKSLRHRFYAGATSFCSFASFARRLSLVASDQPGSLHVARSVAERLGTSGSLRSFFIFVLCPRTRTTNLMPKPITGLHYSCVDHRLSSTTHASVL